MRPWLERMLTYLRTKFGKGERHSSDPLVAEATQAHDNLINTAQSLTEDIRTNPDRMFDAFVKDVTGTNNKRRRPPAARRKTK